MAINNKKLVAVSDSKKEYKLSLLNNTAYQLKDTKLFFNILEENDGFIELSLNGKVFTVELISQRQNTINVAVNGVSYTFTIESPFSLIRKKLLAKTAVISKTDIIRAPMPGKILDVLVTKGQQVNKNEPLIALEAMKMQNVITAPEKGIVISINCKQDDSVGKNDILLEIEKI